MKKKTKFSFVIVIGLLLFSVTACKKSPSTSIYNSWNLVSMEMPDADSTTRASLLNSGIVYTFSKNGEYIYTIGSRTGIGTFKINKEGTSITTTEDGKTDNYNVALSETDLQLSKGNEMMKFTVKK